MLEGVYLVGAFLGGGFGWGGHSGWFNFPVVPQQLVRRGE